MKSWTFYFSASFSCSASLTSYWYNLNPVKINRFLSLSKFFSVWKAKEKTGLFTLFVNPWSGLQPVSYMKLCSFVFQHHMILLQKFPVSGEGASKAVMVGVIVLRNKTPFSPVWHLFLPQFSFWFQFLGFSMATYDKRYCQEMINKINNRKGLMQATFYSLSPSEIVMHGRAQWWAVHAHACLCIHTFIRTISMPNRGSVLRLKGSVSL